MIELYKANYSSEALYDLCRDVTECIDSDYNPKAQQITDESTVKVLFTYKSSDNTLVELLKRDYCKENLESIEDELFQSLNTVNYEKDIHGFHPGTFDLDITIQ